MGWCGLSNTLYTAGFKGFYLHSCSTFSNSSRTRPVICLVDWKKITFCNYFVTFVFRHRKCQMCFSIFSLGGISRRSLGTVGFIPKPWKALKNNSSTIDLNQNCRFEEWYFSEIVTFLMIYNKSVKLTCWLRMGTVVTFSSGYIGSLDSSPIWCLIFHISLMKLYNKCTLFNIRRLIWYICMRYRD